MVRSAIHRDDCPEFYRPYLKTLPEDAELLPLMKRQSGNFPKFIQSIPGDMWDHRYAEGKWSVREVFLHLLDTERVFQYRALRFGRKDTTPLPGFEQDEWAAKAPAERLSASQIETSYNIVRAATIDLFETFSEEDLQWRGRASGHPFSLGALGYIICGHQRYHRDILRARYLGR